MLYPAELRGQKIDVTVGRIVTGDAPIFSCKRRRISDSIGQSTVVGSAGSATRFWAVAMRPMILQHHSLDSRPGVSVRALGGTGCRESAWLTTVLRLPPKTGSPRIAEPDRAQKPTRQ